MHYNYIGDEKLTHTCEIGLKQTWLDSNVRSDEWTFKCEFSNSNYAKV